MKGSCLYEHEPRVTITAFTHEPQSTKKGKPVEPTAEGYHHHTSYDRNAMTPHFLDWANVPTQLKTYSGLEVLPLPRNPSLPNRTASDVLLGLCKNGSASSISNAADLSTLLALTCTVTARLRQGGGDHPLRSVPSAGALYPTEIYAAFRDLSDVEDGLYHVSPLEHSLRCLRLGDLLPAVGAVLDLHQRQAPSLVVFLTAIFFRSAWKYRDRSYRYHLLDTGHVLESLTLALHATGRSGIVSLDFDDAGVERLLGLDPRREVALAAVGVFEGTREQAPVKTGPVDLPELPPAVLEASRVSGREQDYPAIRTIHETGMKRPESAPSSTGSMLDHLDLQSIAWTPIASSPSWPEDRSYPDTLFLRRSRRNFSREPLGRDTFDCLAQCLCEGTQGEPADGPGMHTAVATGFLVAQVQGMEDGLHLLDPVSERIGLVTEGSFTTRMARCCLDQAWLAGASVHVLFLVDLASLDRTWGARGYRYAMTAAGRLGHRVYLAATALGLGCCGIGAFYDREVADLLGLDVTARLLYLVAVGPVRGGIRPR
jgi:SagB-type dehydrogenase family enzyme